MTVDNFIASLMDSGMSLDDVGRELSCALNRKQKEIDEADRKARQFEDHREGLIDNINAAIDVNHFDFKAAASAAVVALIDEGFIKSREEAERGFTEIFTGLKKELPGNKSKEERNERVVRKYYNTDDVEVLRGFLRQLGL